MAETQKFYQRPTVRIVGALGAVGVLSGCATTYNGGGSLMDSCRDAVEKQHIEEGEVIFHGVGDLSFDPRIGADVEDALRVEMVDGALGITDANGDADEYEGGDFRIITEGEENALTFKENGVSTTISLEGDGVVKFVTECPE